MNAMQENWATNWLGWALILEQKNNFVTNFESRAKFSYPIISFVFHFCVIG
jgi:hypothetical protein